MNFISRVAVVKAVKEVTLRKGAPNTSVPIAGVLAVGTFITTIGQVTDGLTVAGNSVWYATPDGNYFWSGNVAVPSLVSGELLKKFITTLSTANAALYAEPLAKVLNEFSITTPLRIAAFIAQTAHESAGYSLFLENLNYSAPALLATWPSRFTAATAAQYAHQPEKIANFVYANRGGNGSVASGDGWKYRGRGVIQITFHDNYKVCGAALKLDLLTNPDLLLQPFPAFRSGGWFWNSRNLNALADAGDFLGITKAINGGVNGLADRQAYYTRIKSVLGI